MRMVSEESDLKSQLVTETCNISRRAIACAHLHGGNRSRSPFIDWYLILRVEENAGSDVIRKQYHKLALQLHPDKNKHPKAEVAFKLLSEVNHRRWKDHRYTYMYDSNTTKYRIDGEHNQERPMNAFLKTQKEQNLTWRDEVAAALSAIELHVQPAIIRQQPEGFFLEKDQVKKPGKALKI
ncbi:hypothetical protein C3L33_14853, partial [Rhododendron williamsianum]